MIFSRYILYQLVATDETHLMDFLIFGSDLWLVCYIWNTDKLVFCHFAGRGYFISACSYYYLQRIFYKQLANLVGMANMQHGWWDKSNACLGLAWRQQKAIINGGPILRFTMATGKQKRSSYVTPLELEVLLRAYGEYEHIFKKKSNTAAAAKERELAWERIAAQVNAYVWMQ